MTSTIPEAEILRELEKDTRQAWDHYQDRLRELTGDGVRAGRVRVLGRAAVRAPAPGAAPARTSKPAPTVHGPTGCISPWTPGSAVSAPASGSVPGGDSAAGQRATTGEEALTRRQSGCPWSSPRVRSRSPAAEAPPAPRCHAQARRIPLGVSVLITNSRVIASPATFGAGPAPASRSPTRQAGRGRSQIFRLRGVRVADTAPLNPQGSTQVSVIFKKGRYTLSAGSLGETDARP